MNRFNRLFLSVNRYFRQEFLTVVICPVDYLFCKHLFYNDAVHFQDLPDCGVIQLEY